MEYYSDYKPHLFQDSAIRVNYKPEMKMPANLPGKDLWDGRPNPWDNTDNS